MPKAVKCQYMWTQMKRTLGPHWCVQPLVVGQRKYLGGAAQPPTVTILQQTSSKEYFVRTVFPIIIHIWDFPSRPKVQIALTQYLQIIFKCNFLWVMPGMRGAWKRQVRSDCDRLTEMEVDERRRNVGSQKKTWSDAILYFLEGCSHDWGKMFFLTLKC